ncbi:MAG: flavodoxin domain-containing protein [Candidatus Heimdallarchaeota archaeon]|nr:flavodoxin domain-containing protein [Candidatus Heimdallarchaeota archaeon]
MTEKKILIVYGTRYGATEGVAIKIAEIFRENNVLAEVVNLKEKSNFDNFEDYDGLIIGSSIKIGQWTRHVKNFVRNMRLEIQKFSGPFGFYVCSGYASQEEQYQKVKEEYIPDRLTEYGISISYYDAFGGIIDFSESSRMGWLEKKIMKIAGSQAAGLPVESEYTDLRDWDQIEKFALGYLELVKT